jgi:hypothetical protein
MMGTGAHMAVTWRLCGGYMTATLWRLCGGYVAHLEDLEPDVVRRPQQEADLNHRLPDRALQVLLHSESLPDRGHTWFVSVDVDG